MYFGNPVPHDHENFHAADELCVAKLVAPPASEAVANLNQRAAIGLRDTVAFMTA
jgi:hypothetical protein